MKAIRAYRKIRWQFKRLRKLLDARECIRKMSFLLEEGMYYYKDEGFRPACRNDRNPLRMIRIGSEPKYRKTYTEGHCYTTIYHWTLVFDDYTYQTDRNKNSYDDVSRRIKAYRSRLPYPAITVGTDDERRMIISSTVHGQNYFYKQRQFHADHFDDFLDLLFFSLINACIHQEKMEMKDTVRDICFCVQHGDPHYRNVVYTDDGPVMIDLNEINDYPLFYDVFFYLLFAHEITVFDDAFEFLRTDPFQDRMKKICVELNMEYSEELTDLYLAAFVYYHINRMNRETEFSGIDYYMRGFERADLAPYPMTAGAIEEYHVRLLKYGIQPEEQNKHRL